MSQFIKVNRLKRGEGCYEVPIHCNQSVVNLMMLLIVHKEERRGAINCTQKVYECH